LLFENFDTLSLSRLASRVCELGGVYDELERGETMRETTRESRKTTNNLTMSKSEHVLIFIA
jgi:hypothetical protein